MGSVAILSVKELPTEMWGKLRMRLVLTNSHSSTNE